MALPFLYWQLHLTAINLIFYYNPKLFDMEIISIKEITIFNQDLVVV